MRKLPPLNSLRAFEAAGQHLSFTKAADALHVTQGAVSRQVKQLEELLGLKLFIRRHHQLHLTPAGKALLPVLQQAFDQIENAVEVVKRDAYPTHLSVNVPPTFGSRWLAPRIARFNKQYPQIELSVTTYSSDQYKYSGQFDCIISFGLEDDPTMEPTLLMEERNIAVCAPELIEGMAPPINLSRFTLLHILHGDTRLKVWEHWLQQASIEGVNTALGIEFSTQDQVINAAVAGSGIAVVDRVMISRELAQGLLTPLSEVEVRGPYGYWLLVPKGDELLPHIALFKAWLLEEVAAVAAEMEMER